MHHSGKQRTKSAHWAPSSKLIKTPVHSDSEGMYSGILGLDLDAIHAEVGGIFKDFKRVQSVAFRMDSEGNAEGPPEDPIIFSDRLKPRLTSDPNNQDNLDITFVNDPLFPRIESRFLKGKSGGFAPMSDIFHAVSNRERIGSLDMGLEDEDFDAAVGIRKEVKEGHKKQRSLLYESINQIGMKKGEFSFPRRTYMPKTMVPYVVAEGQVPKSIIVERLHRAYRVVDMNLVLNTIGVTPMELIPPPHYGETNERFYQEKMFRNRSKIEGIDKFDFYVKQERTDEEFRRHLAFPLNQKPGVNTSTTTTTTSASSESQPADNSHSEESRKLKGHPVIRARPPFEPMLPLDYFDNEDFDDRTGSEWILLGWDSEEKKNYAIPAKAYLPFNMPKNKRNHPTLSKNTNQVLLSKTEKLEILRQTLLTSRYERMLKNAGIDTTNLEMNQNRMELAMLAKATLSVPSFLNIDSSMASKRNTMYGRTFSNTFESSFMLIPEVVGESGESSDDKLVVSDQGSFVNLEHELSEFKKELEKPFFQGERIFLNESDYEFNTRIQNLNSGRDGYDESELEVTKSESLLSEVFSQLESLTLISRTRKVSVVQIKTSSDDFSDQELSSDDSDVSLHSAHSNISNISLRRTASKAKKRSSQTGVSKTPFPVNEFGLYNEQPESGDEDDYDLKGAAERFIFDFDKMKKPSNYDWRWVDAAVLDFDEETHKYFVCSTTKPHVFAWISKIYLCFDAEDPYVHAERIKDAIIRRCDQEKQMRFNLYLDCLCGLHAPIPTDVQLKRIVDKIKLRKGQMISKHAMERIQHEHDVLYERVHSKLRLDKIVEMDPGSFKPFIVQSSHNENLKEFEGDEWIIAKERAGNARKIFKYRVAQLNKKLFYCHEDTRGALMKIARFCEDAKKKSFIKFDFDKDVHLDEFHRLQNDHVSQIVHYLKNEWYESILETIRLQLGRKENPWMNLKEQDYQMFKMSRLPAFLHLLNYIMQDTVRVMIVSSFYNFVNHLGKLTRDCKVRRFYKWGHDLTVSEFPTPDGMKPLFTLELKIDNSGPRYTQLLQRYMLVGNRVIEVCIKAVQRFPKLLPLIMPNFGEKSEPYLHIISEDDKEVIALRLTSVNFMKRGLVPLDSYAQKFRKFMPIWIREANPHLYTAQSTDDMSITTKELRNELDSLHADIKKIETEIPSDIQVSAFTVNTEIVKGTILKKLKHSSHSVLLQFSEKLKYTINKVMDRYSIFERKLSIRSDDIQEVMELRDFVELVPEMVHDCNTMLTKVIKDYEIFEEFREPVSDEDSENKWSTAIQSQRILKMVGHTLTLLDEDFERLYKIQQQDLVQLSDQVDSMTMAIQGLSGFSDLDRANDAAQDIRKIWMNILELEQKSHLLNERGEIFRQPPSETEAIKRLLTEIEPYKQLWFTAVECINVRDSLNTDNLGRIDQYALGKCVHEGYKIMEECIAHFHDKAELQHVAMEVQYFIEMFTPIFPLVEVFKNKAMKSRHWEEISKICGFSVQAKSDEPFKKTLDKGIAHYSSKILDVGRRAKEEMDIITSIDHMALQIENYFVIVQNDKETGVQTVTMSQSALEMVDNYVEETKEIMKNPCKSAFLEILNRWDSKIRCVKTNVDLWTTLQNEWLKLQPLLPIIEKQTLTPNVFKIYKRADRVWRRLIRLVKQFSTMEQITTELSITASLNQFKVLLERIHTGMEEYANRHKDSTSDLDI